MTSSKLSICSRLEILRRMLSEVFTGVLTGEQWIKARRASELLGEIISDLCGG